MAQRLVLLILQSNSHALQSTFNSVLCKLFGAMSSDTFNIICNFFSLKSIEELICAPQNRFVARYIASENCLCRLISREYC